MNEREFRAMTAIKLDGEMLSAEIKEGLRERIAALAKKGVTPGLGTLLVGDDGPSANYVAMKHRDSEELGMGSREVHLPADASQEEVDAVVDDFNADPAVDAYIMQYPFPDQLDYETALLRVLPEKDADGLHPVNLGRLVQGVDAPLACTPRGIQLMLERYEIPIAGQHVVIIGRGSQMVLRDMPDATHVQLVAEPAVALARVQEWEGVDEIQAARSIEEFNKGRAAFHEKFWKVDVWSPLLYDVVINTTHLTYVQAAQLVAEVVEKKAAATV